jgi:HAD superfamily hydrolase (TIGR01509 family)
MFIDLDGTLADSILVMRTVYETFLAQLGIAPAQSEFDRLNGPPLAEVVRLLRNRHSLSEGQGELQSRYERILDQTYDNVRPSPGAIDLLQKAKTNACTVGVVTSNSAARAHRWLEHVNLSRFIDFVVSGDEVKSGKPHPEAYLRACERARCPSAAAIAIEDSPQGARAAIDAGLKTFVVSADSNSTTWPQEVFAVSSLHALADLLW